MTKIQTMLRHYLILTKRLLHKKSFVAILLLVPLLVAALSIAAGKGESGILTVALGAENGEDPLAREMIAKLMTEDSLIHFLACTSADDASQHVTSGEADAAWIFHDGMEESIAAFAHHTHQKNAVVTVIQREDSISLRLTQEKLNALLYPYISYAFYSAYADNTVSGITDAEKEEFYHSVHPAGEEVFEFVYLGKTDTNGTSTQAAQDFLLSPLRGLLSIMVILGGMAAAMFYMQDEAGGFFDRFSRKALFPFSVVYHFSAAAMIGAAVFAALLLARLSTGWGYELLALSLYCISAVGFCLCLRLILGSIRLFATIAPVFILIITVLCPILFTPPRIPLIQYLLPTYYYLNAFTSSAFVWYMAIYAIASHAVACLLHIWRGKRPV